MISNPLEAARDEDGDDIPWQHTHPREWTAWEAWKSNLFRRVGDVPISAAFERPDEWPWLPEGESPVACIEAWIKETIADRVRSSIRHDVMTVVARTRAELLADAEATPGEIAVAIVPVNWRGEVAHE